jgi:hypothetical protein
LLNIKVGSSLRTGAEGLNVLCFQKKIVTYVL